MLAGSIAVIAILWGGDVLRPGSVGRAGMRDVGAIPPTIWMFAAVVVFFALPMAAGFATSQPWLVGKENPVTGAAPDPVRAAAATQLTAYAFAGMFAFVLLFLMRAKAPKAGLGIAPADLALGVGCFLLALPLIELTGTAASSLHAAVSGHSADKIAHPTLALIVNHRGEVWAWALIAAAVLGAPIVEEVVFRGYLQSALLGWTKLPWLSITITSVLFAAVHVGPATMSGSAWMLDSWIRSGLVEVGLLAQGPAQASGAAASGVPYYALVPLFILSLGLGIAFERTKRLGVPIAMHAGFNALNVALALRG